MNIIYFLPKTFHEHCISFSYKYKDTHIFTIFHSPASYSPFWWIGFFLWPVTFLNLFLLCRPEQWYHAKDCHCLSCGHFCPSSHVFLPILYGLLDSWIWPFPPLSLPAGSCRSTLKTLRDQTLLWILLSLPCSQEGLVAPVPEFILKQEYFLLSTIFFLTHCL